MGGPEVENRRHEAYFRARPGAESGGFDSRRSVDFDGMNVYIEAMFGSIGPTELFLIFVVALLVFGPKKLPEIGRSIGKAIREFKKTSDEIKGRIEEEIEASEIKDISKDLTKDLQDIKSEVTSVATAADAAETTKSAEAKDNTPAEEIKDDPYDDPYKDIDTHDDGEGQKIP